MGEWETAQEVFASEQDICMKLYSISLTHTHGQTYTADLNNEQKLNLQSRFSQIRLLLVKNDEDETCSELHQIFMTKLVLRNSKQKFHNKSGSFWLFSLLFITLNLIGQLTSKLDQSEPLIQTNKNFENYNH